MPTESPTLHPDDTQAAHRPAAHEEPHRHIADEMPEAEEAPVSTPTPPKPANPFGQLAAGAGGLGGVAAAILMVYQLNGPQQEKLDAQGQKLDKAVEMMDVMRNQAVADRAAIEYRLKGIEENVVDIKDGMSDAMTRDDFVVWRDRFEAANPGLKVPDERVRQSRRN